MRSLLVPIFALALIPITAHAEMKTVPLPPTAHRPTNVAAAADQGVPVTRPGELTSAVTLADIGFVNGLRLSNLGGHQELFVPLPQDGLVTASELVLVLDDLSAYDAKRNLEVQANDRARVPE